jgi:hypothetical protein
MAEERAFYNFLVDGLTARCRTMPDLIAGMTEKRERLFGEIAYTAYDLRGVAFAKSKESFKGEIPEKLKPFDDLLFGSGPDGRYLNGNFALALGLAASHGAIHPQMRKNIALEMLRFFRDQAKIRLGSKSGFGGENNAFKAPLQGLTILDDIKKRHVQVTKDLVEVGYDEESGNSWIKIPYTSKFWVPGIDITNATNWNVAIIHQKAGQIPMANDPWYIELKYAPNFYLLKYQDFNYDHRTSFHAAKKKSFS